MTESYFDRINTGHDDRITHGWALYELYKRVEKLEARPEVYDCNGSSYIPPQFRAGAPIPKNEGHPIPDYDQKQCAELLGAVFDEEAIQAEMDLIEAVLDYADHRDAQPPGEYGHDAEMREWGNKSHELHTKMIEAARKLK